MAEMSLMEHRRVGMFWLGCALLLSVLPSCKLDSRPVGGLVLSLETDLSVPKDIDRIELSVTQDGRTLLSRSELIGSGHMLLPAELRLGYPGNDRPVLVRATAFRGDEARVERSSITPMPRDFLGLLRVPLGYLCDGTALPEGGSRCGEGNTCNLGSCDSALIDASLLPRYAPSSADKATDGGLLSNVVGGSDVAAASGCFDVSACYASAQLLDIDVVSCSFRLPLAAADARVSVALVLPLGSAGICDNGGCFVLLDQEAGGYRFGAPGEVVLPQGVCDKLLHGVPLRAAISTACGQKTSRNPPCGTWSSVQTPLPSRPDEAGSTGSRSGLGEACTGLARQACGMCGTEGRSCRDGRWDDWGLCEGQSSCQPGATEACGRGGTRTCGGDCEWGACLAQTCNGPSTRACGNCGTQTRRCDNGVWSEWSVCDSQGECQPNDTRECGSGGSQACMGNCRWGSCSNQSCAGAPSEACGKCGTRTRGCDAASGMWSNFGECADEGPCAPDATRSCGNGGVQGCRGDCQWDAACTGQSCSGEAARACGHCGTQTRTCDSSTGTWSEWSSCAGEGPCAPNDTRSCGSSGTQVCGGNCRWDAACSGQSCSGAAQQSCGNCGVQTRSCDSTTGTWSEFSACESQGACRPGTSRGCGAGGMQVCTSSCQWPTACTMQACSGASSQTCGNCGIQTRTCNTDTGQYGDWSACSGELSCKPGSSRSCGGTGTQTCLDTCEWSAACDCPANSHLCNGSCVSNASTDSCGSACTACTPPQTTIATCDGTRCGFGCSAGLTLCGSVCVDLQNDAAHCAECGNVCMRGQLCSDGKCGCPPGQHLCSSGCVSNTATTSCGSACVACDAPANATATCNGTSCGFTCDPGTTMCSGACVDLDSDNNHCGDCKTTCSGGAVCQRGSCQCPGGTHACSTRLGAQCVSDLSPATCGKSCEPCPGGAAATCDGTSCGLSCPRDTHDCGGSCVSDTSTTQCGTDCVQCPVQEGGTTICAAGSCVSCARGETPCQEASGAWVCSNLSKDDKHCGKCEIQCDSPQSCNGQGVCM